MTGRDAARVERLLEALEANLEVAGDARRLMLRSLHRQRLLPYRHRRSQHRKVRPRSYHRLTSGCLAVVTP